MSKRAFSFRSATSGSGDDTDFADPFGGPWFLCAVLTCGILSVSYYFLDGSNLFWSFPADVISATSEDLAAFYRAGEMIAAGQTLDVYQPELYRSGLSGLNQKLLMLNPPHFFFFIEPMSWFDYGTVKAAMLVAIAIGFVALARICRLSALMTIALLTSGGAYYGFITLNVSIFVTALIAFALAFAGTRPILAGVCLAIATVKPQYGLLVPVFLIGCGYWRTFVTASLATIGLVAISAAVYGVDAWKAYFGIFSDPIYQGFFRQDFDASLTIRHSVGKLGGGSTIQNAIQAIAIVSAIALVWFGASRWPRNALIGITLMASGLIAPSLFFYSWPFFSAGLCFMLLVRTPWPTLIQVLGGIVWSQPILLITIYNFDKMASLYYSASVPVMTMLTLAAFVLMLENNESSAENTASTKKFANALRSFTRTQSL